MLLRAKADGEGTTGRPGELLARECDRDPWRWYGLCVRTIGFSQGIASADCQELVRSRGRLTAGSTRERTRGCEFVEG